MPSDEHIKRLQEARAEAQANPKTPSRRKLLKQPILEGSCEGYRLAELRIQSDGRILQYKADLRAYAAQHPDWSKERVRKNVLKNLYEYLDTQTERDREHIRRSMEYAQREYELRRTRQSAWALNQRRKAAEEKAIAVAEQLAREAAEKKEAEELMKEEEPESDVIPITPLAVMEEPESEPPPVDHTAFIAQFKRLPSEATADKQLSWVCAHPCLALAGQWDDDNPMPVISAEDIADAPSRKAVTMLQYAMKHNEKFWSAIMSEDKKSGGKATGPVDDGGEASDEDMDKLMDEGGEQL